MCIRDSLTTSCLHSRWYFCTSINNLLHLSAIFKIFTANPISKNYVKCFFRYFSLLSTMYKKKTSTHLLWYRLVQSRRIVEESFFQNQLTAKHFCIIITRSICGLPAYRFTYFPQVDFVYSVGPMTPFGWGNFCTGLLEEELDLEYPRLLGGWNQRGNWKSRLRRRWGTVGFRNWRFCVVCVLSLIHI